MVTKVTDGVFPLQVYMCEPTATAAFVEAFSQSAAWPLAPIVATLRFWGLSVLVLAAAALAQQASGVLIAAERTEGYAEAGAADPPGFGAVAEHFEAKTAGVNRVGLKFFSSLSRVLLENCAQLWLQSSFFGVVFDRLSEKARYKVLASMALGLAGATYKSAMGIKAVRSEVGDHEALWFTFVLFPHVISLGVVLWTSAKILAAYQCDSHMWNLTSGCVHLAQQ